MSAGEGHRVDAALDGLQLPTAPQHGDRIRVLGEHDPAQPGLGPSWIDGWLVAAEPWGLWWVPVDSGDEAILTPWRKIAEVDAGWFGEGDE